MKSEPPDAVPSSVPSSGSELGTRIKEVAEAVGGVPRLAELTGISESMLYRYINGGSEMKVPALIGIAEQGNVSIEWLATGRGERQRGSGAPVVVADFSDEFALVPRYDVKAAGGGGAIVQSEQVVDHLAFRRSWLHQQGLIAGKLALIEATGDSMAPTISKGDLVLVALDQADGDDGVYVLRRGNALLVKRLQHLSDGRVKVISDNSAYEAEVISPERVQNVQILGRVCWVGRNFAG